MYSKAKLNGVRVSQEEEEEEGAHMISFKINVIEGIVMFEKKEKHARREER